MDNLEFNDTMDRKELGDLELKDRLAALVAEDLSPEDAEKIRAALSVDEKLRAEEAFWSSVQSVLPEAARPAHVPLPGNGMADILRNRLRQEREQGQLRIVSAPSDAVATANNEGVKTLRFQAALGWAVAIAAMISLVILLPSVLQNGQAGHLSPGIAYDENGSVIQVAHEPGHIGMSEITSIDTRHGLKVSLKPTPNAQPWLGLWTRPVDLIGMEADGGLLVVRVVEDGPAAKTGLRPGDVVLSLDEAQMYTRYCIAHAINDDKPGKVIPISYWRNGEGAILQTKLTLGSCWQ